MTYKIIRFYMDGTQDVIKTGLTLEEAQAHCQRKDTRGVNFFDGYKETIAPKMTSLSKLATSNYIEKNGVL